MNNIDKIIYTAAVFFILSMATFIFIIIASITVIEELKFQNSVMDSAKTASVNDSARIGRRNICSQEQK